MSTDPDPSDFDAIAAAQELEAELGDLSSAGGSRQDPDYVASLEAENEQLASMLAKKDEELRRATARADQAHAEIEAIQRRVAASAQKDLEARTRSLLESFLPVIDDLDRAIAAARAHTQAAELVQGVELVRRGMLASLERYGVKHAPSRGELFDPNRHEALAMVPVSDPAQDRRVIDVMREGYVIGDQTLRPAAVAVGKRTP